MGKIKLTKSKATTSETSNENPVSTTPEADMTTVDSTTSVFINDNLDERIQELENTVDRLAGMVEVVLKQAVELDKDTKKVEEAYVPAPGEVQQVDANDLIPTKWREVVDKSLGKDFGLKVADSSGGDFSIEIRLPPQWDRRSGDEKQILGKYDISIASPVRRATAESDLERFCILIAQNIKLKYPNFEPKILQ